MFIQTSEIEFTLRTVILRLLGLSRKKELMYYILAKSMVFIW